jgi:small-conductance mechanosensitive channel
MNDWFAPLRSALEIPLISMGRTQITVWTVFSLLFLFAGLFWLAGRVKHLLVHRLLRRLNLDLGAREAIGSIVRYLFLLGGVVAILQTAGVDLTAFSVFAGAMGIGLGLGLQHITNNFFSGLILLVERPIQVGDRVEVGGVEGFVLSIGARSTKIQTRDNVLVILPNSRFVIENVTNWKSGETPVQYRIPVQVLNGLTPREVEQRLLAIARSSPDVVAEPAPRVLFKGGNEKSMQFELLVSHVGEAEFVSELHHAIHTALVSQGVEIGK